MEINSLIENFSIDTLKNFFRAKLRTFKPDNETYEYLFEDNNYINDHYQIDKEPLLNIPIKQVSEPNSFKILVDKIISKKEAGKNTSVEEQKIDLMIYKLYELTHGEVRIMGPEFEMSKQEYENYG